MRTGAGPIMALTNLTARVQAGPHYCHNCGASDWRRGSPELATTTLIGTMKWCRYKAELFSYDYGAGCQRNGSHSRRRRLNAISVPTPGVNRNPQKSPDCDPPSEPDGSHAIRFAAPLPCSAASVCYGRVSREGH